MSITDDRTQTHRRGGALAPTIAVLAVIVLGFMLFARIWTDLLWYRSVEAAQVFRIRLGSTIALFAIFGLLMALVTWINMVIAYRMRPKSGPTSSPSAALEGVREAMDSRSTLLIISAALVVGILAGVGAVSMVDPFLAWINSTPFGTADPYFNLDVSFFIFDLPWWRFVVSQVIWTLVISLVMAAAVHFITGSMRSNPLRISTPGEGQVPEIKLSNPFSPGAQSHLSVIIGLILLAIAADQFLGRYVFAVSDNDALFTGIGYTDDYSRITAKLIIAVICVLSAVAFFVNAKLRRWILPTAAVALAVASSLIVQGAVPAFVQRFDVLPNEPNRERPFIENQIAATREAYGISDVEITDYAATTTVSAGQLKADAAALPGIRLMDPQVIAPAFEQLQQVRGYYSFPDVLDVDRYTIDEQETDAIVAVREINPSGLPAENQSWNNLHTVYTHGYALVGAYGNRRQPSGEPDWIVRDIPPVGAIEQVEPRVYFGENTDFYSVVGAQADGAPVELDTPVVVRVAVRPTSPMTAPVGCRSATGSSGRCSLPAWVTSTCF